MPTPRHPSAYPPRPQRPRARSGRARRPPLSAMPRLRLSPASLLLGFLLGVAASYWVSLQVYPAAGANADRPASVARPAQPADAGPAALPRPERQPLAVEFYDLLPAGPLVDSDEPTPTAAEAQAPGASQPYALQVGAFSQAKDADHRRAALALMGLSARIETAQRGSGTLYRVLAGPYASRDELLAAQRMLSDNRMDSVLRAP